MTLCREDRKGVAPSTFEAFENVLKCIRKRCTDTGRGVKEAYTADKIGPETGLAVVHKIEGTGKNESAHR